MAPVTRVIATERMNPVPLFVRCVLAVLCLMVLRMPVVSHEGPEHDIEELTERISKEGESAHLLLQRAIEYQVLGKSAEAARDLERALQFDTRSAMAQQELSRAYFTLGKTNEALQTLTRALRTSEGPDHASLLIARAEVLRARREHQKALVDADQAIREYPGNVEWYLLRSQLQARLKLKKERIQGLEAGITDTGGGILENELVDALIEDQRYDRAAARIEPELNNSRLKSGWLVRRARIRMATGKTEEAKADLEAALRELERRIAAASPDPSLLAERGLTRELLGKKEEARKDYEQARDKGLTDEWVRERLRLLKGADEADKD